MHNTYEQKIPSIAASVAILNSSAKVTVKGDLTSDKDLEVSAKNNFKVNATASSKTYNAEGIPLAVFVGKFNSGADVIVENTANLKSKGALSVSSHQNSSVKTDAEITIGEKSYGGIAFNYTELNTHADTSFHGVLNTSTPSSSITIEADNRTSDLTVRSVNMSNLPGVTEAMQNLSGFSTAFLDGLFGGSSSILGTTLKEGSFKNGGVATVVTGTQTASVKVGGTLEAKGDIKIASSSVLYDHFFEARNAVETKAEDDGQEKKEQGAISILVQTPGIDAKGDTVESSLVIEDNASIHSSEGQIIISSQAQIEWNRVNKMKEDLQEVINAIKKYANEGFSDQWDLVEKANADLRKAFDEVGRSDLSFTEKMLKIAEGLKNTGEVVANFILEAKVLGELLKTSTVDVVMGALEFIKPTNYFNAYVASSTAGKEKVGLSGSILFKQQSTSSITLIGKNTHIWTSSTSDKKGMENVGNIIIRSDGLNESLTLGGHLGTVFGIPLPGITKSHTAVGGSLNLNMLKSNNQTMIQEGALIEAAKTLGVNSADRVYGLNIGASSDVNKGKTVVDLLLAMTMAEGKNALSVDDEAHLSGKELTVVASRDDDLQTIAGAIVVGAGEDASNVAGAGFAFNDANLENTWKIEDNDSFGIVDGMLVDNKLPSIVDNNPGQLKSSGTVLLLASHDVAMNAIGVAGSIAYTAEDDGSKNFLVRAAETISGIKDSITNFAGTYKSEYHAHFNDLGKKLNKRFTKTQTENDSAGSAMSNENNASLAQGGDTATTNPEAGGEGSGSGSEDSRTESFQISLAGSFGMNFSEVNNQLIIDAKDFSIQSSDISIDAVTDKWIGAWAGAAGISYVSGNTNTSTATSIGGAVAVNSATFNNRIKVSGLSILHDPDGDFQTLRIRSTSNGNLVAEGLPLALSMGDAEKNNAFDAGVSANLVKTSVENSVSDLTREEETQKLAYEQTAWAGDNQITGGTGFSFAGQGTGEGTSYAGSLIVAVAQIENTITTKLENSTLKGVDSAQVKALANLNQVTTAISGSISSNSKSFNFSGAAAAAELKNTVDASINGVTFEGPGSQSVLLASRVGGAEEEKDLEDLSKKKWYAENLDQLSNTAYFKDIGIYTEVKTTEDSDTETESSEPKEDSQKKIGEIKNLDAFGSMKQATVVLSPTFGDKGVGAAVVVNEVSNTFGTKAENSSILLTDQNSKFLNEAVNDVFTLGLAVGVAGGKGVFNAAGSVVVSNIEQTARVFANNLNINAHQTDFLSKNEAIAVDVAGNVAVTVGESSKFAGGASVTVMNTNNYASLEASDISVQGVGNEADATLKAENQAQSWGVAVDAAVSTKVGIGGAVAVNRVLNRSFVSAKDITSSGLHSLKFNAFDNGEVWTLAGNVAVGTQGGGASGAVGYSSLGKKEDQGSGVSVQGLELDNGTKDAEIYAEANGKLRTLVIGVGAGDKVGLAGAASTNEINNKVSAEASDIRGTAEGTVKVAANSNLSIGSLGVVAGGAKGVGVGLAVAVNRINNQTAVRLLDSSFTSQSLTVQAYSDNDIDTIGIGGAGGQTAGVGASTAINLVNNTTTALVRGTKATARGAIAIQARSDDTFGTYGGQATGAQGAAVGATVTVTEKKGETKAEVEDSTLEAQGDPLGNLEIANSVKDENINDKVFEEVSVGSSLGSQREIFSVNGIAVDASSTETFKTLYVVGSGAQTAGLALTGNVVYSGGSTTASIKNSQLTVKNDIDVHSGDYLNIENIVIVGSGAQGFADADLVTVNTTDHTTNTLVTGSSTLVAGKDSNSGNINISSEGKEGISEFGLVAAGAQGAALSALVFVNRQLSDVRTDINGIDLTANTLDISSDFLGRINALSVVGAGSVYGTGAVGVLVNYGGNDVSTSVAGDSNFRIQPGGSSVIQANRVMDWSQTNVTVSGAAYGALGAYVTVNTIEGLAKASAEGLKFEREDADFGIKASSEDHLDFVNTLVAGAIGSLGTSVVVNYVLDDVETQIKNSDIKAQKVSLSALKDYFIDGTNAFVTGGVGTIGANVVVNVIGKNQDAFSDVSSTTDEESNDLEKEKTLVGDYLDKYGDSTGISFIDSDTNLTDTEKRDLVTETVSGDIQSNSGDSHGTRVVVSGSEIKASEITLSSLDNTKDDAHLKVTVGTGQAGAGVLGASVTTLRQHYSNVIDVHDNKAFEGKITLDNRTGGTYELTTWQTSLSLASGTAAYVDAEIDGGLSTNWTKSKVDGLHSSVDITTKNESAYTLDSNGITVAGISGGGMVARLRDLSETKTTVKDSLINGSIAAKSIRAQRLTAQAMAGYGGAVNGVGALASVNDGSDALETASIRFTGNTFNGSSVIGLANHQTDVHVKAYSAGASAIGLGIVKAQAWDKGNVVSEYSSNTQTGNTNVSVQAAAGRNSKKNDEQLQMTVKAEGYGGAAIQTNNNEAKAFNQLRVSNTVSLSGKAGEIGSKASGHAVYEVSSEIGSGGAIASSSNSASVHHEITLDNQFTGSKVSAKSLSVSSSNEETANINAKSAGGSVVTAEGTALDDSAALVEHIDESKSTVTVSGSITTAKDIVISADSTQKLSVKADNTKGTVVGGSGASLVNHIEGVNAVVIDSSAEIHAQGDMTVRAKSSVETKAADDGYAVDSGVYGAIAGTGIKIDNRQDRTNSITVNDGVKISGASVFVSAEAHNNSVLKVRARSAGVATGVTATGSHDFNTKNLIDIKNNVKIESNDLYGRLVLSASADEVIDAESIGNVQGAAVGGAGAEVTLRYTRTNEINVGSGSEINSAGDLEVYSGRDISKDNSNLDLTSYSHAYSHTAVGGTNSSIDDSFVLNNSLNLNGNLISGRDSYYYAANGDVATTEMSRYWFWTSSSDAGNVQIASTAAGNASKNLVSNNTVVVNGSLIAGQNTKADIEISGIVHKETDPKETDYIVTVDGSQSEATIQQNGIGKASISEGSEDLANVYFERHVYLQKAIADLSFAKDDKTTAMVEALKQEDEILVATMREKGWLDEKGQIIGSQNRDYIAIRDLAVSGGNLSIDSDSVTGNGSIVANAAEGISITNKSNLAVKLENVQVMEKGGKILLNGNTVTKVEGFDGNVQTHVDTPDPTIKIHSQYEGGEIIVHASDKSGNTSSYTVKPDNSIEISGRLFNGAGDVSVISGNDIYTDSTAWISAAGSLNLKAGGNVTQSYHSGIYNVGGDVAELWKDHVQAYLKAYADKQTDETLAKLEVTETRVTGGSMVAGGDIFIAGDMINLNGLVQSGYSHYEISLGDLGDGKSNAEERINQIKKDWVAAGSPKNINPISSAYELTDGSSRLGPDGSYIKGIASWYDPSKDQIVLEDVNPQGGHIYITGKIASTGGGKLIVSDGHATVNVNAGSHDLKVGNISTGNISGLIRLTDTAYRDESGNVTARITEYKKDDSGQWKTTVLNQKTTGEEVLSTTDGIVEYSPKAGLIYGWSEGRGKVTLHTLEESQDFTFWSLFDWGDPSSSPNVKIEVKEDQSIGSGQTIGFVDRDGSSADVEFVAWNKTQEGTETDSGWNSRTWTTYDNWTHFSGTHHRYSEKTVGKKSVISFGVKADKTIGIQPTSGENKINLSSDKSVILSGAVSAHQGVVSIQAGENIVNASSTAGIWDAAEISLIAKKGSVGTESSAISFKGTPDITNLSVQAAGAVYLDASQKSENSHISASLLQSGGILQMNARGDLDIQKLVASDISLVSSEGGVQIQSLEQKAQIDGRERLDITAAKSINVKGADKSDIALGHIKANGEVRIESVSGNIYDALDRTKLDEMTAQEQIERWIQAGILSSDGQDNGEAVWKSDVQDVKDRIEADWNRYQAYLKIIEDNESTSGDGGAKNPLTKHQEEDFGTLKARFEGKDLNTAIAEEENDPNSLLGKLVASKDNYGWTQEELLFAVSDAILNPDPDYVPVAGEPNVTGSTVTLISGGMIGENLEETKGTFAELSQGDKSVDLYKLLARADVNDVHFEKNGDNAFTGNFTINLKRTVEVDQKTAEKGMMIQSEGSSYIQSVGDSTLLLGDVSVGDGEIFQLTAVNGIRQEQGTKISGHDVLLRGGKGSLGDASELIHIDANGVVSLSASQGVYIQGENQLNLQSVSSGSDVYLVAKDIYAATDDGVVRGQNFVLISEGNIGTKDHALALVSDEEATLKIGDATGDVYLSVDTGMKQQPEGQEEHEGGLSLQAVDGKDINVGGNLSLSTNKDLNVSNTNLEASDVYLFAGANFEASNTGISSQKNVFIEAEKDVTLNEVKVEGTASENFTVHAKNDVQLNEFSLAGYKSLEVEASEGRIDSTGMRVTDVGQVQMSAQEDVDIRGASIKTYGPLHINAAGIQANNSVLESSGLNLSTTRTSIELAGSQVKVVSGDTVLQSADKLNLAAADSFENASDGALILTALNTEDDAMDLRKVFLKDGRTTLEASSIVLTSNGGILFDEAPVDIQASDGNVELSAGTLDIKNGSSVKATEDIRLEGKNTLKVGDAVTLEGGKKTSLASEGELSLGDQVCVTATEDVSLTGGTVTAGNYVELSGAEVVVQANQGAIKAGEGLSISAEDKDGNGIVVTAAGETEIGANAALSSESSLRIESDGSLDISEGSSLTGKEEIVMNSGKGVRVEDALVQTDISLSIEAKDGNVELIGGTQLNSQVSTEIKATGNVVQTKPSTTAGIQTDSLDVVAGGDVLLQALGDGKGIEGGNKVNNMEIEAGGRISIGLNGQSTSLTINQGKEGILNSSLDLIAPATQVEINNDLNVSGNADLSVSSVIFSNLKANGDVQIVSHSSDSGSVVSGQSINGQNVLVDVSAAEIRLGDVNSQEVVTIVRREEHQKGSIETGKISSGKRIDIVNGNGDIVTGSLYAPEGALIFVNMDADVSGIDGSLLGKKLWISRTASSLLKRLNSVDLIHIPLSPDSLSKADTALNSGVYKWTKDTHEPQGKLFDKKLTGVVTNVFTGLPISTDLIVRNYFNDEVLEVEKEGESEHF